MPMIKIMIFKNDIPYFHDIDGINNTVKYTR